MEVQGLSCHGCGSTDVGFDPKTRKIHCRQCGREEYYSRAQLGATGKVAFAKDNAIQFFKDGNWSSARTFANDVLNTMQDNAAALFIVAYCDEFEDGRSGAVEEFFGRVGPMALEYGEVRDLIELFEGALYNMRDYEAQMVTVVIENMQGAEDRQTLEGFIETVCPYCISRYASEDFLSDERAALYRDIASHCDVPKTCFALLKGIRENPGSPYRTGSFRMRAHTGYFLEHYVEPVGRIIQEMRPSSVKAKFVQAYQQLSDQYRSDASAASG
ncbi:hypothetical protein [Tractidigestivibacter sp.]|uniref:hypothetical protein n=1 Tax=Tractidigestivibacter sp. TaxID=2847320 RepID=UPI002A90BA89|nr:hypothetical protein [Tractidigestivibacter sp.]MCI6274464.1 hypothetical protein [Coriobacteriaceae bacterium]MDY5271505.1 hypothetical protein [Tractidigestivibacter sp.]